METGSVTRAIAEVETMIVGGARVAKLDMEQTAALMVATAREPSQAGRPFYFTSVNGEVLTRRHRSPEFAELVDCADLINADGQPLVFATRLLMRNGLPERVATTDLYGVVAAKAQEHGVSFYLLGATEDISRKAYEQTKHDFPRLDIRGHSHGYLAGEALERKLDEINALAPDILWLGLGVPYEQKFVHDHAMRLSNVKIIKTSGGLFDFVARAKSRAPRWVQNFGFEWAYRLGLEPRRLLLRYLTTNPVAFVLLLTQTRQKL